MVTDEMIRVALLAFQSGDMDWSSQDEELMRFALEEAFSAMPKPKPVTHLVWLQGRRAADDVEDYYEVARPGDKSVDGSDPFPVYATPPTLEAALSAAEPVKQEENPMRFFADNVDNWGALEWFNRLTDACEDHDRKRTQAFRCTDPDEKDMLSLSADTSKMIMSSSALHLAREHKDEIRSALSAQVQDVADMPQSPWPASDWAVGRIKELEAQAIPEGWQLVPKEPTHAMISAMAESKAKDDEGEFLCLSELLDFSGENKTHTVLKAAYRAALPAAPAKQEG